MSSSSRKDLYERASNLFAVVCLRANAKWHIDHDSLNALSWFVIPFRPSWALACPLRFYKERITLGKINYPIEHILTHIAILLKI